MTYKIENYLKYDRKYWRTFSPTGALELIFRFPEGAPFYLETEGNGDEKGFGCWETEICLEKGCWYEASVQAYVSNMKNPEISLLAVAAGHYLEAEDIGEGRFLLKQTFLYQGTEEYQEKFCLFLRSTAKGSVIWKEPILRKIPEPKKRIARIAAVHFPQLNDKDRQTLESLRKRIGDSLEDAGKVHPDLVLLTEMAPICGVHEHNLYEFKKIKDFLEEENTNLYYQTAERVPDGDVCKILSEKAKKFGMYVVAGILKKEGEHIFNTAVIFGRDGELVGQYDKTHLTFGELVDGISCGNQYPVFELDFGKVAIHICYDEWFPEVSRDYANQGAEMLLLPVAGGKPITWTDERLIIMEIRHWFMVCLGLRKK